MRVLGAMMCLAACAAAWAQGGDTMTVTPAADGQTTQLTSAAGVSLSVPLSEVQALAVLKSPNGVESVLLSGRSCTECDENRSLYLVPMAYRTGTLLRYDYPGKLSARDSGKTVQRVRAFYGACTGGGKDSLVLLMSFLGADGHWHRTNSVLYPAEIPGRVNNPLELKTTVAAIEQRVKTGACHELPSLDQRSEP